MLKLKNKIETFPVGPGVYLMKESSGRFLYVGKALNLKKRVSDYFTKGKDRRYQVEALMEKAADIEYIVTKTEKEALLLEYNLIQEHKPKYNIFFKDDKRYVSIKLSAYHKFPGIYVTRKTPKDGSNYFGPYVSTSSCRQLVEEVRGSFKLRNCSDHFFANRSRPCIQYEINLCTAPCTNRITQKNYEKSVKQAALFLKGNVKDLLKKLESEMQTSSNKLDYEKAAALRDTISAIKATVEPQYVSDFNEIFKDYVGLYKEKGWAVFAVVQMRRGVISGVDHLHLKCGAEEDDSLWENFLIQYYKAAETIPLSVLVDFEATALTSVMEILSERKGRKIMLLQPKRGKDKNRLLMAKNNAKEIYRQKQKNDDWPSISKILRSKLCIKGELNSVACVDISNISGKYAVGSVVFFEKGQPNRDNYRRFKIQYSGKPNDYEMMREVLIRLLRPSGSRNDNRAVPDLLLIDGGRGHLMIVAQVIKELGVKGPVLAALAKGKDRKGADIYLSGRKNRLKLKSGADCLLFLIRVRNEAHRFGISAYRARHRKGLTSSALERIPGVGPKKRALLLKKFESVEKIKECSVEELSKLPGITSKLAKTILTGL